MTALLATFVIGSPVVALLPAFGMDVTTVQFAQQAVGGTPILAYAICYATRTAGGWGWAAATAGAGLGFAASVRAGMATGSVSEQAALVLLAAAGMTAYRWVGRHPGSNRRFARWAPWLAASGSVGALVVGLSVVVNVMRESSATAVVRVVNLGPQELTVCTKAEGELNSCADGRVVGTLACGASMSVAAPTPADKPWRVAAMPATSGIQINAPREILWVYSNDLEHAKVLLGPPQPAWIEKSMPRPRC